MRLIQPLLRGRHIENLSYNINRQPRKQRLPQTTYKSLITYHNLTWLFAYVSRSTCTFCGRYLPLSSRSSRALEDIDRRYPTPLICACHCYRTWCNFIPHAWYSLLTSMVNHFRGCLRADPEDRTSDKCPLLDHHRFRMVSGHFRWRRPRLSAWSGTLGTLLRGGRTGWAGLYG